MTISKAIVERDLRTRAFEELGIGNDELFHKIDDQTYGTLLTDLNGIVRYVRIKAVVAAIKEDIPADAVMADEIAEYEAKVADRENKAAERAAKAERDKAKRAAKAQEKEKGE